ncbi:MAG: hypothetical protein QG622_601 [Actinomycetota bacterium]|nr:hypothetical protein [Actinomycetota bacterium]
MTPFLTSVVAVGVRAATPSPTGGRVDVRPTAPAFAGHFNELVGWVLWGCTLVCVMGIAIIGAMLALSLRRGETGEYVARLLAAATGVIIVGLSSTIVNALMR